MFNTFVPSESETWQCMLCTNVLDCSEDLPGEKRQNGMSARDLRVAQRIVLELYCQYEHSLPFREVVSSEVILFAFLASRLDQLTITACFLTDCGVSSYHQKTSSTRCD